MEDEDLDLSAWAAPPAPSGLGDRVIAQVTATDAVAVAAHQRVRTRRVYWLAGGLVATLAAAAAVAVIVLTRSPEPSATPESGTMVATRPQQLSLPGAVSNLDPGASVSWQLAGDALHVQQHSGAATWRVDKPELFLDVGAAVASIEASNATLRVETRMNLTDARVIGAAAVTSAAVALVTVSVYEGQAKLSSAGQTVVVQPGTTYQVASGKPPTVEIRVGDKPIGDHDKNVVTMTVGGGPPALAASDEAELVVPLGERIVIHEAHGRIKVAVDPACPSDPRLLWANPQHAPLVAGSYAFAHTCDGVEHKGTIDVLEDGGDGFVLKPKMDEAWKSPLTILGAGVAPPAHVTIEDVALAPSDQKYWVAEVTPKHPGVIAVRIDGEGKDVHYYIRRDPALDRTAVRPAPERGITAAQFEAVMRDLEPSLERCVKQWPDGQDLAVSIAASGSVTEILSTDSLPATDACLRKVLRNAAFPKTNAASRHTYHVAAACNVEDLQAAGTAAVARGAHAEAVKSYDAALKCKFDIHSLQLAFMAACRAGEVDYARKYWKRMSADMKTHLLQMCLHEHITEDQLNE